MKKARSAIKNISHIKKARSATYAREYNSIMKCFFERLGSYKLYASLLGGKYGAGISTAYDGNTAKKVAKNLTV